MGSIMPKIQGGFRYKRGSASKSKTPKRKLSVRSKRKSLFKKGGKKGKGKGSKRRTKKAGCGY